MRWITLLLLPQLWACQTTDRGTPSEIDEAQAAAAGKDMPDAAENEGRLTVGVVTDEDLRRIIYKALDARISKKQVLDEEGEQTTEIGDFDSFRFTITRLAKGKFEVTGNEVPDTADVDVTGWYKVSVDGGGERDAKPACTSFDASLTLIKVQGEWRVPEDQELVIGREDGEDCF